ncbi:hypothetical protein HPG69_017432 [Diceros bicornis minor]|uniref:Uncharacterized protein n=1 Tax=Diceros bicornis minor TaxID=77932 RepID=A0A7J7EP08_DICBM|nr:hypothetical protein HPG69_017432 [Diceros bicornis minor]
MDSLCQDDWHQRGQNGEASHQRRGRAGDFPSTLRKLLHAVDVPSFNKAPSSRPQQTGYKPLSYFGPKTTFPCCSKRPWIQAQGGFRVEEEKGKEKDLPVSSHQIPDDSRSHYSGLTSVGDGLALLTQRWIKQLLRSRQDLRCTGVTTSPLAHTQLHWAAWLPRWVPAEGRAGLSRSVSSSEAEALPPFKQTARMSCMGRS